jgi:hypothetical protein
VRGWFHRVRAWFRRVRKYVVAIVAGVIAALAAGVLILSISLVPHSGFLLLLPLPWLLFSIVLGVLTLWVLLTSAGAAGPLARLAVALIVSVAVFWYVESGPQGGYFDRFGPLGFIVKPLGNWLTSAGLANFDSVLWRVSLLGGLFVLAIYPFIRASLGGIFSVIGWIVSWLWQSLRGTDDEPRNARAEANRMREESENADFFTNLTTRHAMLGLTTIAVMLVVLMLPILLSLETWAGRQGWQFLRVLESGEHVVWASPLLLILELTAISLRNIPWRGPEDRPVYTEVSEQRPPQIDQLFQRLRKIADRSVIFFHPKTGMRAVERTKAARPAVRRKNASTDNAARVLDGMQRLSSVDPGRLGQIGGPLDQFLNADDKRGAKRLAIAEGLTTDHYLLFALLISHELDDGGAILVVAPDDLLSDVRSNLKEALARCGVGFAISEFEVSGFRPSESELFNLIFVRESLLHRELLDDSKDFAGFLERLRLIFLIEAADMDLSWLRLRLLSLWQLADYRRTRIVVQSANSTRLNEIIGLVATQGGSWDGTEIALASTSTRATHVLMFDDTDDLRGAMRPNVISGIRQQMSVPVMLAFESLLHDCPPIVYKTNLDPADAAQIESQWGANVTSLQRNQEDLDAFHRSDEALTELNRDLFRRHLRRTDTPATVIAWDTHNFLAVKDRNYNFFRAKAFLVQILSKPYPMRDFLRQIDDDPEGFDQARRSIFLPHAPRLAGGLAELTYLTVEAMRRGKGLTRSQFKTILATVPTGRFLHSAGIGNDRSGIERLLVLQRLDDRGVTDGIDRLTGERIFKLANDAWNPLARTRILQNGKEVQDVELDYSDRGLTFGELTRIRIGDRIWGVVRIEPNAIHIQMPPPRVDMPTYVFVNAYRFSPDVAPIVENTRVDQQPGSDFGSALLHASFKRTTEQIYEYPGGDDPFSEGRTLTPRRVVGQNWTSVERNRKCVAHLVLTGLSGVVPTGSSPPGHPSMSDELSRAAVALAVCTIIKDTIASLFPDAAPRISVLSNQLGPLQPLLDLRREELKKRVDPEQLANQIELTLFLVGRIGHLAVPEPSLLNAWASEFPGGLADRDDILEIFVIEDSDWDLGVARAVFENDDILYAAASFAEMVTNDEEAGGDGSYLRFGAAMVPNFVYLRGAYSVLSRYARVKSRPASASAQEASP